MQPKALDIEGQARIRGLWREVSGHHLLLCHWVSERALIIAMWVEAKALGPAGCGSCKSDEDSEDEEGLLMNLCAGWEGCPSGLSESGSPGTGEGQEWKGCM